MMSNGRRQRRRRSEDTAPSCPVCGQNFPSVRNFDPVDHERMIMRHITKCSAPPGGVDTNDDAITCGNSSTISEVTPTSEESSSQQEVASSSSSSVAVLEVTTTPKLKQKGNTKRKKAATKVEESPAKGARGHRPHQSVRVVSTDLSTMDSFSQDIDPEEDDDSIAGLDSSDTESEVSSSAESEVTPEAKELDTSTSEVEASTFELEVDISASELEEDEDDDDEKKPAAKQLKPRALPKAKPRSTAVNTNQKKKKKYTPSLVTSSTVKIARTHRKVNTSEAMSLSSVMVCPICSKTFPRMCYFAQDDYERKVLEHVMSCSSNAEQRSSSGVAMKPPVTTSSNQKKKKKPSLPSKRARKSMAQHDTESTISSECSSFGTTITTVSKKSKVQQPKKPSTYLPSGRKRPLDPNHFLNKMWWREKKTKRASHAKPFNLQQCVVAVDESDVGPNQASNGLASVAASPSTIDASPASAASSQQNKSTRGSKRLQSRYGASAPSIKLCCPICGREFKATRMGAITEQTISRHVSKCTQKMFDTGIDISALSRRNRDGIGKGGRRALSEEEKRQRSEANAKRARSMTTLLSTSAKDALDEIFVKLTDPKL